ncbi:MAG: hypothetical protein A4E49_00961 [Methanosaeta sp. PtaU1.Bin112]|nr:MAG: hypothetical protein A4E49_00961 [Methanosaeta sp. PtaU1.Bin112]
MKSLSKAILSVIVASIFVMFVEFAECSENPHAIDSALVTIDLQQPVEVNSLSCNCPNISIIVGYSRYSIPFEDIAVLNVTRNFTGNLEAYIATTSGDEINGPYPRGCVNLHGTTRKGSLEGSFRFCIESLKRGESLKIVGLSPLTPQVISPTIPEEAEQAQTRQEVTELDLGLVHYTDAPQTWTIDVPENFNKVEAGQYGKDGTINQYGGWNAYLEINGRMAWKFVRHDSLLGGIFHDYIKNEDVQARMGEGKYLDVTSMVTPGKNKITFYHYTEGDAGIKIRIQYVVD